MFTYFSSSSSKQQTVVTVCVSGLQDSTATVTVRVVDANDNTPVIPDQQLSFQAERNQGDVITTIQVTFLCQYLCAMKFAPVCLFVPLSVSVVCLFLCLSVCLSVCLSSVVPFG